MADRPAGPARAAALTAAIVASSTLACVPVAGAASEVRLSPCSASALHGDLGVIAGSGGLGRVVYRLRLHNRSRASCFVSGLVGLQMLGRSGRLVLTQVVPQQPGAGTAVLVALRPRADAWASLRFAPCSGRDLPVVTRVRVTVPPSGGTLLAPMRPALAVCGPRVVVSLLQATRPR